MKLAASLLEGVRILVATFGCHPSNLSHQRPVLSHPSSRLKGYQCSPTANLSQTRGPKEGQKGPQPWDTVVHRGRDPGDSQDLKE